MRIPIPALRKQRVGKLSIPYGMEIIAKRGVDGKCKSPLLFMGIYRVHSSYAGGCV